MSVPVGYWIKVECKPESNLTNINFIKIIPSDRTYESQPIGDDYHEILARKINKEDEISIMFPTGSLEDCQDFIDRNFVVKGLPQCLSDLIDTVHKELRSDCLFLKKSELKKNREISVHIANALGLLDILQAWNDMGIGDMET